MIIQTKKEKIGHLLMHVCRERGKTADQFMTQSKIFRGQGMMLMFLSEHEGLTHTEIAEKLNISPAAATKVIKRLEAEGYIQRQSDEKDERISRVFMQEAGRAVISGIHSSFKKLDEQTFQDFGDDDLDRLEDYLHHILTNLKAG
jgi:DNA-binding MarR family transcriptional regulator